MLFAIIPAMKRPKLPSQLKLDPYDLFILGLTGLSFISLLVMAVPASNPAAQQIAFTLDIFLSLLFLVDFFYTLASAPDKRAYLKWGWLDFLGSLPYLPLLRVLRVLRAIRSLRILRHNSLYDIWETIKQRPERTTVFTASLFSILLVSLSSYAILVIEAPIPDSQIQTPGEALWWAIVTITTVGYGDFVPTTSSGRLVAGLLMLMGIGMFSAFTSYLSTSFINRRQKQQHEESEDLAKRLDAIETQLKNLNETLAEVLQNQSEQKK